MGGAPTRLEKAKSAASQINARMDKINGAVLFRREAPAGADHQKAEQLHTLTPDDTGTGTSYKGWLCSTLLLFTDRSTALVHDSVILKQIADEPLERIMKLYGETPKQVFIALDKKGSYTEQTQQMLESSTVISLSDGGNELFGRSWNIK